MRGTNYGETLVNFIKGMLGVGIYSTGVGFKHAGLVLGIIITTIMAITVTVGVHMMVIAMEFATEINEKQLEEKNEEFENEAMKQQAHSLSFAQVTKNVILSTDWKHKIKLVKVLAIIIRILLCIQYMGSSSLYLVFIGKSIIKVLKPYGIFIHLKYMILMAVVPTGALALVPNMKGLAVVSLIANILFLLIYVLINYYLIKNSAERSTVDVAMVGKPETIPIIFGMLLFSFEVLAVVFPMRCEMQNPEQLRKRFGIINIGYCVGYILILFMGIIPYLVYGDTLSDTILFDLPDDEWPSRIALIAVAIYISCTYSLQMYVPIKIFWELIVNKWGPFVRPYLVDLALRLSLVLVTLLVAQFVPFIDLIGAFVGTVCATWLTLILGPILYYIIKRPSLQTLPNKRRNVHAIVWSMIVWGFICFCIGIIFVMTAIVREIASYFFDKII